MEKAKTVVIVSRKNLPLLLSSFLILLGAILIIPYGNFQEVGTVPKFWFGISIISLGFIISWAIPSINSVWFWSITILARLILIPMEAGDDIWRYLWEGYIQNLGFNPYDLAPNALELVPYRTEWWSLINHPDTSAIYPPLSQLGFRFLALINPSVFIFKLAFIFADLGICWLLSRKFSLDKTLIYAWNPLIIYSFAGGGHYDSWFLLPLVAAWLTFIQKGRRENEVEISASATSPLQNLANYRKCVVDGEIFNLNKPKVKGFDFADNYCWYWSAFLIGVSVAIKWVSLPILCFMVWQKISGFREQEIGKNCGAMPMFHLTKSSQQEREYKIRKVSVLDNSEECYKQQIEEGRRKDRSWKKWMGTQTPTPTNCKHRVNGEVFNPKEKDNILRSWQFYKLQITRILGKKKQKSSRNEPKFIGNLFYPKIRQVRQAGFLLLIGLLPMCLAAMNFCDPEKCSLIPTSSNFVVNGRSAELIPYLVSFISEQSTKFNWIYGIPLCLGVGFLIWNSRKLVNFIEWYFFLLLTLSPIIHAWYFTWLIPFAVATKNLGTRWVSLSAFIYFILKHRQTLGDNNWFLTPIERYWLWLPLIIGFTWSQWKHKKNQNSQI
ncbi:MAG: hypothetical protein WBA93_19180 [Microcoleaceae cyanobacterium]